MSIIEVLNGQYDWGIDSLVGQLRELRLQSLETRSRRNTPPKLPSKKELQVILDGLGGVLFPNRLGLPDLNDEGIDYFVGHTLETLLRKLYKQVSRELQFVSGLQELDEADYEQAIHIVREFATQLPIVRKLLDTDIQAAGATILGRITIGRGSTIGGNVWLTHNVSPGSNITQAHVRNELFLDGAGI